ncbi:hypothetical protein [Agrobacterium sp. 22-223-1]
MATDNAEMGEARVSAPTIHLLRHGETVRNCLGRFQGQSPDDRLPGQTETVIRIFKFPYNGCADDRDPDYKENNKTL